jgi:hypothetical protein
MRKKQLSSILLVLILLAWAAPPLLALAPGGLASALGCELNEGSVHPCILFGSDIGKTLYTFGVLGWLSIIGIRFVVIALAIWVVVSLLLSRRGAN